MEMARWGDPMRTCRQRMLLHGWDSQEIEAFHSFLGIVVPVRWVGIAANGIDRCPLVVL